jgi:hypothetical protein
VPAPAQLPEVFRDAHPLAVEDPQLTRLDMAQLRPTSEERGDELVAMGDLVSEISRVHRREIVWKLFHGRSVPTEAPT